MAPFNWRRSVSTSNRYAGLDHLRAIALILVIITHYDIFFKHPAWTSLVSPFGWIGVDLFFVLSGFLIAGQLFEQIKDEGQMKMSEFYIKRLFRVLPSYFLVLLLYFMIPDFREINPNGLAPLWRYLTFTLNLDLDRNKIQVFTHAWSLCIEEQFYLLLPFILFCFLKSRKMKASLILVFLIAAAGFYFRIHNWTHIFFPSIGTAGEGRVWLRYIYYPTYTRLDGLLIGVCLAALFQFKPIFRNRILRYGNLTLLIGLCLVGLTYLITLDPHSFYGSVFGFPLISLAFGFVVLAAVSPSSILYKFNSQLTGEIAKLSFFIYLLHKAILHLVQTWLEGRAIDTSSNWVFAVCMLACTLGGLLLFYVVEKPLLKVRNTLLNRLKVKHLKNMQHEPCIKIQQSPIIR